MKVIHPIRGRADKLNDCIEKGFGITSFENEPKTIAELIAGIEKTRKEQL